MMSWCAHNQGAYNFPLDQASDIVWWPMISCVLHISVELMQQNPFLLFKIGQHDQSIPCIHTSSNLCEATKILYICAELFIRPNWKEKKMQPNTWRCFKYCGINRLRLMCEQMLCMAHKYAGDRSCARASINSWILWNNIWIGIREHERVNLSSAYPRAYSKLISDMYSWSWRSHPISEYWYKICSSQGNQNN